jgi:D-glycero-D-manno-heptose 1,7-bisphosphate phosphatase
MPADPLSGAETRTGRPRVVVLDRDGVINEESPDFIRTPADWRPLTGSIEAIAALSQAGFRVYIATNQSGIARGLVTPADLTAIHARLRAAVAAAGGAIAGIYFCPHGPDDGCDCRKPAPGLLRRIEAELGWPLASVPVIGDSARDLAAAAAVGARGILVLTGNGRRTAAELGAGVETWADLAAVTRQLLAEQATIP